MRELPEVSRAISTAGDAALTVSEPGHLTNGAFALGEPLEVRMAPAAWSEPVSNAAVAIAFSQLVKASDPRARALTPRR